MEASIHNMERWRGNTLYRVNDKGARVIARKRTKHLPKEFTARAVIKGDKP
jgi:hypothetical protein